MRIIIADDHTIVRAGIKKLLKDAFPFAELLEASNTVELLSLVRESVCDVVVSDITMPPGDSGLEAVKEIKSISPQTSVVIMSMHSAEHYAVRAFKSGATGYLSKDAAAMELVKAVNTVLAGKRYVNEEVAALLEDSAGSGYETRSIDNLSDRELEVLKLLGRGKTIAEIAGELSLSTHTISTFRAKILEKMNFHNNMELIRFAVDNKLT